MSDDTNAWVRVWSKSPLPPWIMSGSLLAQMRRETINQVKLRGRPTIPASLFFASVFGGSGYLIASDDPENGAGLTSAWSAAYMLVYGSQALKSFRVMPVALSALATCNCLIYGQDYFGLL